MKTLIAANRSSRTSLPVPMFPIADVLERAHPAKAVAARRGAPSPATPFPGPTGNGHSNITRVVRLRGVAPQRSAGPTPPTPDQITAAVVHAEVVVELHVVGSESPRSATTAADRGWRRREAQANRRTESTVGVTITVPGAPHLAPPFPVPKRVNRSGIVVEVHLRGVTPHENGATTPPIPVKTTASMVNVKVVVQLHAARFGSPSRSNVSAIDIQRRDVQPCTHIAAHLSSAVAGTRHGGEAAPLGTGSAPPIIGPLVAVSTTSSLPPRSAAMPRRKMKTLIAANRSSRTSLPVPMFPIADVLERAHPAKAVAARRGAPSPATPFPGPTGNGHSNITRVVRLRGVAPQRSAGPTPPTPDQITAAVVHAEVVVELHVVGSESPRSATTAADRGWRRREAQANRRTESTVGVTITVPGAPHLAPPFPVPKRVNRSGIVVEVHLRGVTPREHGATTPPTPAQTTAAMVNVEVVVDLHVARFGSPCRSSADAVGDRRR